MLLESLWTLCRICDNVSHFKLEFEDQGTLYLICLPGNMQVSSVAFRRAVLNRKKLYFYKINKNVDILIPFISFHPPGLNASCFFLEHQWMFEHVFNSCVWVPQLSSVWKDGSQNHSHCWKGFKYAKDAVKLKNLQDMVLRTSLALSLTVQNKQGTHEQPSLNSLGSSRYTHSIKNQRGTNFWMGLF